MVKFKIILFLLPLGLIVLGSAGLSKIINNTNMILDSQNWVGGKATITSSKVEKSYGKNRSIYTPKIEYKYIFDNKNYNGNRIKLSPIGIVFKHKANEVIRKYPRGRAVTILINPKTPTQSVIIKPIINWLHQLALGGLSVVFMSIGILGFVFFSKIFLKKPKPMWTKAQEQEEIRKALVLEPRVRHQEQNKANSNWKKPD